ncbi:Antiviral helicase SKI2 [Frankliniella fusca]|uniref:Antiviral helicase SKI2 n=1 Tax=Frankliniella fusca TaxID=407009 RepID=A0AAE1LPH9_9NEOP|nr:Antiviral helicase SKI2 [Frankliniella fusca]
MRKSRTNSVIFFFTMIKEVLLVAAALLAVLSFSHGQPISSGGGGITHDVRRRGIFTGCMRCLKGNSESGSRSSSSSGGSSAGGSPGPAAAPTKKAGTSSFNRLPSIRGGAGGAGGVGGTSGRQPLKDITNTYQHIHRQ